MSRRQFGSVRRLSSGRWQVRFHDLGGVRKTATHTFATKTEAQIYLDGVRTDMERGVWRDPTSGETTLADWSQRFMTTKAGCTAKTMEGYEDLLRVHILPHFGRRRLDSIRPSDVQAWLGALARGGLGASRQRQALGLLSQMLKLAVADGLLADSAAKHAKRPAMPQAPIRYLTLDQVDALAAAVPSEYRALVYVLMCGGLRWGEAIALKIGRCELLQRRLLVAEAVSTVRGELVWGKPKNHQARHVHLPIVVVEVLASHIANLKDRHADALVFPSATGQPIRYSNFLRRVWHPALAAIDIDPCGTHIGRHTAATLLIAAGADVKDVQALLGHKDATMTLNTYAAHFQGGSDGLRSRVDAMWEAIREGRKVG